MVTKPELGPGGAGAESHGALGIAQGQAGDPSAEELQEGGRLQLWAGLSCL